MKNAHSLLDAAYNRLYYMIVGNGDRRGQARGETMTTEQLAKWAELEMDRWERLAKAQEAAKEIEAKRQAKKERLRFADDDEEVIIRPE